MLQQQPISYKEFTRLHNLDYKPHQQQCVDWCLKQEGAPIREPIREPRFCFLRRTGAKAPTKLVASGGQPRPEPLLETPRVGRSPHQGTQVPRTPPDHGGLIADEMGLGKTIQIIALIHANPLPTTLIVVPVALLAQWHEALTQLGKSSNDDVIHIYYHGSSRKKHHLSTAATATDPTNPSRTTYSFRPQQNHTIIALTTYGEISRPKSRTDRTPASPIHSQEWSRIVFDEAHHLRNPKTNVHQAALQLSSKIKWLLTGTPIQNSRRDFHALCDIIGIPSSLYKGATIDLPTLTRNYIIKRTKQQLQIPMPELKEHVINVKWADPNERELARQLHTRIGMTKQQQQQQDQQQQQNLRLSKHKGVRLPEFSTKLVDYLRTRQLCILPRLVKDAFNQALHDDAEYYRRQDNHQADHQANDNHQADNYDHPTDFPPPLTEEEIKETQDFIAQATSGSSKLNAIVEHIVKDLGAFKKPSQPPQLTPSLGGTKEASRKLVFCEFRKEMDLLEEALTQRNIITGRIDGSTPKNLKEATVASTTLQVLLLQVRTCSEGLNLQQYSDVYIVTPQWNPTIEHQAIARSYRIGQTSNQVNVYRFVMEHDQLGLDQNIETKVIKTQEIKKEESKLLMAK